jgi:hypothetical protein
MFAVLPTINISLFTGQAEAALDALVADGMIIARIFNDARSEDGTYYFRFVDKGRGPVRPINAKALHWIGEDGKDVFAMYAKGVPPRHIVDRAIAVIQQEKFQVDATGKSPRKAMQELVNAVAVFAVDSMKAITPVVSSKLHDSYRIEPAGE